MHMHMHMHMHMQSRAHAHALYARAAQAEGSRRVLDTPSLLCAARPSGCPSDRAQPGDVRVEVDTRSGGSPGAPRLS